MTGAYRRIRFVACHVFLVIGLSSTCPGDTFLPSGLTYVWWRFGTPEFDDLQIDFTIHTDLPEKPGIYLQFYQGKIGDVGFYFGLQTDVYDPAGRKGRGKGILFSRWKTRDTANLRPVSGGWTQSAGYEGDFVGIRCKYEWTNHSYRFRLTRIDEDDKGVWYGLFILDYDSRAEDYIGSIRFPRSGTKPALIRDGGGSWTEVYSGAQGPADLPYLHMSIGGAYANSRTVRAQHAFSNYSKIPNTEVYFDRQDKRVHMKFGPEVDRQHPKGQLF